MSAAKDLLFDAPSEPYGERGRLPLHGLPLDLHQQLFPHVAVLPQPVHHALHQLQIRNHGNMGTGNMGNMATDGTFTIFQTAIRKTGNVPSVPGFLP